MHSHSRTFTHIITKQAMERDMSLNCWQHLQTKLKSMAKLYFSLSPEQRLVPLPASS